ncbi:phage head morphogenesis protein [Maridesulfovibrio bastinii]|uniref:phage head morphogenesis protein n=1 Tax=Maridesulfovibrio bastinii TaxID=47157 RepID=UPI00041EB8BF|nr:phage head morphogenesis protein [Maridesulfovibrio bastinii]
MISIDPLQPEAALKFWAKKVPVTRKEFDTLSQKSKAQAFTVSGINQLDQVIAVQNALDKMLKNGGTLVDFKKEFPEIIKAQGWTGKKAHRVDNIFRTNLQCAYMAGRYEQMKKTNRLRPYWQYIAVEDKRTRPSHMALDGKVYPAEHEFWNKYYPPNGFRCRCTVMSLSERQLKKMGLKVENEFPGPTMVKLPDGSEINVNPMPDKGWARNVGKDAFEPDYDKYPDDLARIIKSRKREDTPKPKKQAAQARPTVKTRQEMVDTIIKDLGDMSKRPIKSVQFKSASYFMATNSQGTIFLSTKNFPGMMTPSKDLLSAFKKIGKGQQLHFHEEYALESLWHEMMHNNQVLERVRPSRDHHSYRMMEIVNQWVSRRTYPRMLEKMGATPVHLEKVKAEGWGYGNWLKEFGQLLDDLGVKDNAELLEEMEKIHSTIDRFQYTDEVTGVLAKISGKDESEIYNRLTILGRRRIRG